MVFSIEESEANGEVTIVVRGDIDLYSSPQFRQSLWNAIERVNKGVSVDLEQITYMDSSGVATLVEALRGIAKKDASLTLIAPSQPVVKVLQLARLDTIFDIRPRS